MELKNYGELYCYFKFTLRKIIIIMMPYIVMCIILLLGLFSKIIHNTILMLDIIIIGFLIIIIWSTFYKFIKQAKYSFNYLKNNEKILENELRNFILDKESWFILTENYYIDLATLNIIKFDEIIYKKYRFGYSLIPNITGLNRYCILKDKIGTVYTLVLYSSSRKSDEGSKVYDIIEERLSNLG